MRSLSGGSLTTFLMFLPLLAVPLLAIFGIPEFSPVNASPSTDSHGGLTISDAEPVRGQSDKHTPDDLFADVEKRAEFKRLDVERRADPFQTNNSGHGGEASNSSSRLKGWTVDPTHRAPRAGRPQKPIDSSPELADNGGRNPFASADVKPRRTSGDRPKSFDDYVRERAAEHNGADGSPRGTSNASVSDERVAPAKTGEASLTWQSAAERLEKLGIKRYCLQPGSKPGEFHFSCVFQPHRGSRVKHRFEAEAREPLHAVERVLGQIENWLRRR